VAPLTWTCTDPTCARTHAHEVAYCPICCEPRPAEVTRAILVDAHIAVMEATPHPPPGATPAQETEMNPCRSLLDIARAGLVWTGAQHEAMATPAPAGIARRLAPEVTHRWPGQIIDWHRRPPMAGYAYTACGREVERRLMAGTWLEPGLPTCPDCLGVAP